MTVVLRLRRSPRPSAGAGPAPVGPLAPFVAARARLSTELLLALADLEHRTATLDDIEWADAVAERVLNRRAQLRDAR